MAVGSLAWFCHSDEGVPPSYDNLQVHMGLCASPTLGTDFAANYIPGTKVLVYQADSLILEVEPGEWVTLPLQVPFDYNGTANLLVEILHEPGSGYEGFYAWNWDSGADRSVMAYSSNPDLPGSVQSSVPCMAFEPPASLQTLTFGAIKSILGGH